MAAAAVAIGWPLGKWALGQLWDRLTRKEEQQDKATSQLREAISALSAEMRSGFTKTQDLINDQALQSAKLEVRVQTLEAEVVRLREGGDRK